MTSMDELDRRIAKFMKQLIADGILIKDWAKWDAEHEGLGRATGGDSHSQMDFHGVQSIKPGTEVRGYYQGHPIVGEVTGHRGNSMNANTATAEVKLSHDLEGDDIVSRKAGDTVSVENDERGHYIEPTGR